MQILGIASVITVAALTWSCTSAPANQPQLSVLYPADAYVTPADGYLYEAEMIAPLVHVFASPEPFHLQPYGNVTAIEQVDGFVLVDSGGTRAAAERLISFIEQISDKPVKVIVITHWHGDHANGLRTLVEHWPAARTISTMQTRATLSDPHTERFMPSRNEESNTAIQRNYEGNVAYLQGEAAREDLSEAMRAGSAVAAREMGQYGRELRGGARLTPAEGFSERMIIDDGAAPVDVLFLGRANTDGDAVVWLPQQHILVTGDVVVSPIPYGFGSYPLDWIGVLNRLRAYDFDVMIPGHGRPMRDKAYLDLLITVLTDVRAQVAPLATQGLPIEEVQSRVDLSAHVAAFAGGDAWRAYVFDIYWKQPIVASAYNEARGITIVQGAS